MQSSFEREIHRGLLECVARFSIGLTDKVWLGHGEMAFVEDLKWPDDAVAARIFASPFGEEECSCDDFTLSHGFIEQNGKCSICSKRVRHIVVMRTCEACNGRDVTCDPCHGSGSVYVAR